MLDGGYVENPRREIKPHATVFDWRELKRWNIPAALLPPGSTVLYRPATLWEQHAPIIAAGLIIIVVQAAFIIALIVQHARRREAEEEARGLNKRLLSANEDERRRMARDLHDDFSHRLARVSFDAAQLERVKSPLDIPRIAHDIRRELAQLSEDLHTVSHQLHPAVLEDLGLVEALRSEGDQVSRAAALSVVVDADDVPEHLPGEIALCAFRVAQEALRNVIRHARASAVNISVRTADGNLCLAVHDDGIGFDPAAQRRLASLGHASMRERVRLLGGELDIRSTPGFGTTIEIQLPLPAGDSSQQRRAEIVTLPPRPEILDA
jgi:signal transduction histidine kinase